jgi:hypothetical protein
MPGWIPPRALCSPDANRHSGRRRFMTNTSVGARHEGYLDIGVGAKLRHARWSSRRGRLVWSS